MQHHWRYSDKDADDHPRQPPALGCYSRLLLDNEKRQRWQGEKGESLPEPTSIGIRSADRGR
jgi:hypothetical protein